MNKNIRRRRIPVFWWWSVAALMTGIAAFFVSNEIHNESSATANAAITRSISESNHHLLAAAKEDTSDEKQESTIQSTTTMNVDSEVIDSFVSDKKKIASSKSIASHSNNVGEHEKNVAGSNLNGIQSDAHSTFSDVVLSDEISIASLPDLPVTDQTPEISNTSESSVALSNPAVAELENDVMADVPLPMVTPSHLKLVSKDPGRFIVGAYYSVAQPKRVAARHASSEFEAFNNRTHPGKEKAMGLSFGYNIWKGLSVMSGIETSSFKENHEWTDTTTAISYNVNVTYDVTYPIDENTPVITMMVDTTEEVAQQTERDYHVNSYSSLNLPLLVSYQQPLFSKLSIIGEIGPVFRIDRSYIGSFVEGNGELHAAQSFTADSPNYSGKDYVYINEYYSSWRTDLHAGLALSWVTNTGLGIRVGAQQRMMMKNSGEVPAISHRILRPGWNVGICYRF